MPPNPSTGQRRLPFALLRHTLPDGTSHLDWVLGVCTLEAARAEPDRRDALTFRLRERPTARHGASSESPVPLIGQRLTDHRRLYLWFEGELPPGTDGAARGRVERVGEGWWRPALITGDEVRFTATFEDGEEGAWWWRACGP